MANAKLQGGAGDASSKKDNSKSQEIDLISMGAEYFRLSKAAKILYCEPEDVLHLGAMGHAEIMAPVIADGVFEWPVRWDGTPLECDGEPPFRTQFCAADRVILLKSDLAKIEAIGWTIPRFFCAPIKARELGQHWNGESFDGSSRSEQFGDSLTHDHIIFAKTYFPADSFKSEDQLIKGDRGLYLRKMEECAMLIPWNSVHPSWLGYGEDRKDTSNENSNENDCSKRTTINHLFISKDEMRRLSSGQQQDKAVLERINQTNAFAQGKEHGNTTRFSKDRIAILKAAIYCLNELPGAKLKATQLAKLVEQKASQFWPEGSPPLALSVIEEMLSDAIKRRI